MLDSDKLARLVLSIIVSVWGVLITTPTALAAADTCTWDGSESGSWSNGDNWTGCDNGGVPDSGDTLIFPNGAGNKINSNDIGVLNLDSIIYSGDNYTTSGNAINLTGGAPNVIIFSGNLNNHNIDTTITASESKAIAYSGSENEIGGGLILAFSDGDMNFSAGAVVELEVSGIISGTTGNFVVGPDSDLILTNTNTFSKTGITINTGAILDCGADECTGAYSGGDTISIYGSGWLALNAAVTLADNIGFIDGTGSPGTVGAAVGSSISGSIIVGGSGEIKVQNEIDLDLTGDISFTGGSLLFEGTGLLGTQSITHSSGTIFDSPAGEITVDNVYLELNSSNASYDGSIDAINGAVILVTDPDALGSDIGETIIEDGSSLAIDGSLTINELITITGPGAADGDGAIYVESGSPELTAEITLGGDATLANWGGDGDTLLLSGNITGTGDLSYISNYSLGNATGFEHFGTSSNDYSGSTTIDASLVIASKTSNAITIPGDVTINGGSTYGFLELTEDNNVADDATITLNNETGTATFYIPASISDTVGTIVGDGTFSLGLNTPIISVGADNENGTFSGTITSDEGEIDKVGTGAWTLTGTNETLDDDFSIYRVSEGKLLLNFSDSSGQFSDYTVTGGTLGGSGVIGNLIGTNGVVAPGNSPGCIDPDGDVTLSSNLAFSAELNGPTACTDYDRLNASGTVNINNATLQVDPGYTPEVGTVFTIIQGVAVSGTFAGLPDGSKVSTEGLDFRVNYTSTAVTLTALGGTLADTGDNLSLMLAIAVLCLFGAAVSMGATPAVRRKMQKNQ